MFPSLNETTRLKNSTFLIQFVEVSNLGCSSNGGRRAGYKCVCLATLSSNIHLFILAFVLLPLLRKLTNADVCKDEGVMCIIMHFVGMVYFRWRFSDRRVKIEKLYLLGVPVHQSSCLAHPRPGNYLFG